jgi:methionine-rich copper-binding protein CopC
VRAVGAAVLLGLGTAIGALLLGPAPIASAHTELLSTTPAEGATLQALPAAATLTFSDAVDARYTKVAVSTPAAAEPVPVTPTVSGSTVTVPLTAAGAGGYAVVYRVVSADGHPVSGRLGFTVAGAATSSPSGAATATGTPATTPATQAPATQAAATPAGGAAGEDERATAGGARIAGAVAIVVALGVVFYAGRRRVPPPADDREPVHRP